MHRGWSSHTDSEPHLHPDPERSQGLPDDNLHVTWHKQTWSFSRCLYVGYACMPVEVFFYRTGGSRAAYGGRLMLLVSDRMERSALVYSDTSSVDLKSGEVNTTWDLILSTAHLFRQDLSALTRAWFSRCSFGEWFSATDGGTSRVKGTVLSEERRWPEECSPLHYTPHPELDRAGWTKHCNKLGPEEQNRTQTQDSKAFFGYLHENVFFCPELHWFFRSISGHFFPFQAESKYCAGNKNPGSYTETTWRGQMQWHQGERILMH